MKKYFIVAAFLAFCCIYGGYYLANSNSAGRVPTSETHSDTSVLDSKR